MVDEGLLHRMQGCTGHAFDGLHHMPLRLHRQHGAISPVVLPVSPTRMPYALAIGMGTAVHMGRNFT